MNLEGRTEVLSQLVDIEYKKLGLDAVSQIEIVYLPFAINGTTDKNNRIMLSVSRISREQQLKRLTLLRMNYFTAIRMI